ncbi:MAG: ribonuclease toxin HepT-like protein [Candidatus Caldatribacteriaceae bacterium]
MGKKEAILSLVGEIESLLQSLETVVDEARERMIHYSSRKPDRFDLRGLGSLLHDFYTIVEDIFELISQDINGSGNPESFDWHKRLLSRMSIAIPEVRPAVISEELKEHLEEYLRFRHVFRNVYGHLLEWERVCPLLEGLEETYRAFRKELGNFKGFLLELAHGLEEGS